MREIPLIISCGHPTEKKGGTSMKKIKGNKGKFKLAVMVIVAVGLLTGCAHTTKDLNEQSVLAINWVQTFG